MGTVPLIVPLSGQPPQHPPQLLKPKHSSHPDRIFDLGSDGTIRYVSRDFDTEKMKGRHFADLVNPEHRAYLLERWEEIKRGVYKPFEIQTKAKDGSKRDLLITARIIKGTDRFILVQRDITDFKNLEEKFYESQKLAAVGQLSAGIAHEVRNPLSSIKMSLQILEKPMNPEGNDLKRFRIAQREVEHLEKLVNDILVFARPAEPEMTPGDINQFLKYSLNLAEKEIDEKKIRIENRFDDKIPLLPFDSAMLKQAFLNLYLNAIDAMETGGVLSLASRLVDGERKSVSIEIADNGAGIEDNVLPHIFNPFFTTKNYGTGLGLSQVKKIVDLHGGTIEIASKKGSGTKVTILLPLKRA
jgi:two-component system sensor histidine kinase HydH